ncbi:hypothetical protein AGMMS50239_38920 [Bacteroidia bacterium]|nr:hypothetical protein AGMMS50239_38920 [Bacteroidia bacterium]
MLEQALVFYNQTIAEIDALYRELRKDISANSASLINLLTLKTNIFGLIARLEEARMSAISETQGDINGGDVNGAEEAVSSPE